MNKQEKQTDTPSINCPNCGSVNVATNYEQQQFLYGKEAVSLHATVAVRSCTNCHFEFTDWEAEEARDKAIREYLHAPTGDEVESVRKKYHMSRAEFAAISGLGSASLARWETGALIPNAANARYLFLLSFAENITRLRAKDAYDQIEVESNLEPRLFRDTFPAIKNFEQTTVRAIEWKLRSSSKGT